MDIFLDKSRNVRLLARVGEASVPRPLVFTDEDGNPYDITSLDFKLFVFKRSNSTVKLFTLSIGDGLTIIDTNILNISISAIRANQNADTYFYRLHSAAEDHTWLNGAFVFHNGESDNVEEDETVNIYQHG